MDSIEKFFENPEFLKQNKGDFGTLYLLRRDVNACFNKTNPILWPGVITIFAGIDLLGKFYAGEDDVKKTQDRFKNFLTDIMELSDDDANILYKVRNSLVHSYGLHVKNQNIILTMNGNELITIITKEAQTIKIINIEKLKEKFEESIENYRKKLLEGQEFLENFKKMFNKYGIIHIE